MRSWRSRIGPALLMGGYLLFYAVLFAETAFSLPAVPFRLQLDVHRRPLHRRRAAMHVRAPLPAVKVAGRRVGRSPPTSSAA